MGRHPQLELDIQLCFPLAAASRAVTHAYGPLLEPFGLTYPQYLTLLALWSGPERQTVGDLGRRLRLDSGTLTPLLKRLENAGLIERERDPDDERRVIVTLTPAGGAPIVKFGSTMANPTGFVEDPGTDADLSIDGTYLRFSNLTAPSFTLTSNTELTTPNGFRAPVNAIQIVTVPEAASATLACSAAALLAGMARRRRRA